MYPVSCQLYTTGREEANDYTLSYNCNGGGDGRDKIDSWAAFRTSTALFAPSIGYFNYKSKYQDAVSYFAGYGVTVAGFIVWPTN